MPVTLQTLHSVWFASFYLHGVLC